MAIDYEIKFNASVWYRNIEKIGNYNQFKSSRQCFCVGINYKRIRHLRTDFQKKVNIENLNN